MAQKEVSYFILGKQRRKSDVIAGLGCAALAAVVGAGLVIGASEISSVAQSLQSQDSDISLTTQESFSGIVSQNASAVSLMSSSESVSSSSFKKLSYNEPSGGLIDQAKTLNKGFSSLGVRISMPSDHQVASLYNSNNEKVGRFSFDKGQLQKASSLVKEAVV